MDKSSKYEIPWDLISESLTTGLPPDAEAQLEQWLSAHPDNREKYRQISELWKKRVDDYRYYRQADENKAWDDLKARMGKEYSRPGRSVAMPVKLSQRPKLVRNLWLVAAMFVGLIGISIWYSLLGGSPVIYRTAVNEQKKLTLKDGTVILLQPLTSMRVPHNFGNADRTVFLVSGEAHFDVVHNTEHPFTVDMGSTRVSDIGTSFTVRRGADKIHVAVTSGKVAFVKLATKEKRELVAGSGVTFDVKNESFGIINKVDVTDNGAGLLKFEDTPLSEAVASIERVYGEKISISDKIANRKITAQLNGMTFDSVIKVICGSFGLEYSVENGVYILKEKTKK